MTTPSSYRIEERNAWNITSTTLVGQHSLVVMFFIG